MKGVVVQLRGFARRREKVHRESPAKSPNATEQAILDVLLNEGFVGLKSLKGVPSSKRLIGVLRCVRHHSVKFASAWRNFLRLVRSFTIRLPLRLSPQRYSKPKKSKLLPSLSRNRLNFNTFVFFYY